ncbi:hypothetical protein [Armatimonas sp.]|uniref:hypothetical protein n=1 Tax=Armatimonas sp. TaxID=1872638 RepID=UPI00286C5753|nr:hypothetical protein [Armatimonas sp.]
MKYLNYALSLTTIAIAIVSTHALAQPPRGGFGMMNQPLTVVSAPAEVLGKELKLSEEVQKKVAAIQKGVQDKMTAAMQELRDSGGFSPEAFQELQKKNTENAKKAETEIMALLSNDQKKALPDVMKALQMLRTLGIPVQLNGDLKLTEEQKTALAKIAVEVTKDRESKMKEMQEARENGDQDKMRELMQAMRTSGANPKALAALTADQKAMIEKYIKDHPQQPGRRPGGN